MPHHAKGGPLKALDLLARLPFPAKDGGAIGVCEPLLHTKRLGVDWVVAALYSERHEQDIQRTRAEFETFVDFSGTPDFSLATAFANVWDSRPYNLALRFDRPSFHRMLRAIKTVHPQFDVIQVDWIYMAPYIQTCRDLWPGTPILMRQHNAEFQIFERLTQNESNPAKKAFLALQSRKMRLYEAKHMNQVDLVVPVTQQDADSFVSIGVRTPIVVNPAGANLDQLDRPVGLTRNRRFLIVGSMNWPPYVQSMVWFLEHVWSRFASAHPGFGLDIIGKEPPASVMAWNGVDGVRVHGYVDDIMPYMHESMAMVIPLLTGSGMRIKMVEAMAAGLPVITTPIGCEGIPVLDGEHAVVREDPDSFIQGLDWISKNPEAVERMVRTARELAVAQFSWDGIGRRFVRIYEELSARRIASIMETLDSQG
jgi:glycosyltransferase involved in cell wall biosynthesis